MVFSPRRRGQGGLCKGFTNSAYLGTTKELTDEQMLTQPTGQDLGICIYSMLSALTQGLAHLQGQRGSHCKTNGAFRHDVDTGAVGHGELHGSEGYRVAQGLVEGILASQQWQQERVSLCLGKCFQCELILVSPVCYGEREAPISYGEGLASGEESSPPTAASQALPAPASVGLSSRAAFQVPQVQLWKKPTNLLENLLMCIFL